MPIYEYQCDRCNHKLEIIQKVSDELLKFCPECGEESLRKLISSVSFRLKGTGWYETDFKTKVKGKDSDNAKPDTTDTSKATDKDRTTKTKATDSSS